MLVDQVPLIDVEVLYLIFVEHLLIQPLFPLHHQVLLNKYPKLY